MDDIKSDILEFYGSLKKPSYSKVIDRFEDGFPEILYNKLNGRFWIKDVTDVNSDTAFFINLLSEGARYLLIYSFVSTSFHIVHLRKTDNFDSQPDYTEFSNLEKNHELVQFCKKVLPSTVCYLERRDLAQELDFNWDNQGYRPTLLYKILFLQEGELPYFV